MGFITTLIFFNFLVSINFRFLNFRNVVDPNWKEVEVKKQKVARKRPSKSLNLCRGPGCKCGKSFVSREELQTHYLERGCFTCKDCDERFPSKLTLKDHIQDVHLSVCLLDKDNG